MTVACAGAKVAVHHWQELMAPCACPSIGCAWCMVLAWTGA